MVKKILNGLAVCVMTGLLISGCASTPPTRFYVLEPLSSAAESAAQPEKRLIGIGPIAIPALLDRKQMVSRTEDNGVQIAEFHQWAAPLKDNIAQVISYNLSTLQPRDIIRSYPWGAWGSVDYRVVVDIQRFDSLPGKSVNLEASWAIMNEKNHQILANGRSRIEHPLPGASYTDTVKALSQLLAEFSRELAQALNKVKPL